MTVKTLSFAIVILLFYFMTSCSWQKDRHFNKVKALENEVFESNSGTFSREKMEALVEAYVSYASKYPQDTTAPAFLLSASNLSMNFGMPERAEEFLNKILLEYPAFRRAPESLFMLGFIYENFYRNFVQAREYYSFFIEKYPDHELADDAVLVIKDLGKTADELIEGFEKKVDSVAVRAD